MLTFTRQRQLSLDIATRFHVSTYFSVQNLIIYCMSTEWVSWWKNDFSYGACRRKNNHPPTWRPRSISQQCYVRQFAVFAGEKTDLVTDAWGGTATIWSARLLTQWEARGCLYCSLQVTRSNQWLHVYQEHIVIYISKVRNNRNGYIQNAWLI